MPKSFKEINKAIKRFESSIHSLGPYVDEKLKDKIVKSVLSLIEINKRDAEKSKPKGIPGYAFVPKQTNDFPVRAWFRQYDVGPDFMYSLFLTKKHAQEYEAKIATEICKPLCEPKSVYISQQTLENIVENGNVSVSVAMIAPPNPSDKY